MTESSMADVGTLPVVPLEGSGSGRCIIQGLNFKGLLDSIHSYSESDYMGPTPTN